MDILKGQQSILGDGAFGTYFLNLYPDFEQEIEWANIIAPQKVEKVHEDYIKAGAKLIRTNTFSIPLQASFEIRQTLLREGYRIAKDLEDRYPDILVAASLGPILEVPLEEKKSILLEEVKCLYEAGCRLYIFETFPSLDSLYPSLEWLKSRDEETFIMVNFAVNESGYSIEGHSLSALFAKVDKLDLIDCVGANCIISSGQMRKIFENIKELPRNTLISAMPNGGKLRSRRDDESFIQSQQYFAKQVRILEKMGVHILGGCCGTTPDFIREISNTTQEISLSIPKAKEQDRTSLENAFYQKLLKKEKVIAVELDPPFNQDIGKLKETAKRLKGLPVDIITFADSPLARSRMDSVLTGVAIHQATGIDVMPHICCRDKNSLAVRGMFLGAHANQIRNFLIITGDPIQSEEKEKIKKVFNFNSISMMEYVTSLNHDVFASDPIIYGGAINQSRSNFEAEIKRVKEKIKAGCTYFLTQPIYSDQEIDRLLRLKEEVDCHILCGIMPFVSYKNASFIKNEIKGIDVPDEILALYDPSMSKEEAENVGVSLALSLMKKMESIASGFYFMLPFNRVSILEKIFSKGESIDSLRI